MRLIAITTESVTDERVAKSPLLKNVCESTLAMYPSGQPEHPWIGYLAEQDQILVGTCAFKSPPTNGAVEIAYFTFLPYEGRGVASRMAGLLLDIAMQQGARLVRAQTLPEANASTRILEKLAFTCLGSVAHPEDGTVWEWQRSLA